MKILFLADVFPYPASSGGRLRTYNLVKELAIEHQIDFVCKTEQKIKPEDEQFFLKYVNQIKNVHIDKKKPISRIGNLLKGNSDKVFLAHSIELQQYVNKKILENTYDLIFVDSMYMYQYVLNNSYINRDKIKIILDLHNVEHEVIYRMMKNTSSLPVKMYSFIEYKNMKKVEKLYIDDCDMVYTVSNRDREIYINLYNVNEEKIIVIDNGIDVSIADNYCTQKFINPKERFILFIGSLWYRPNRDGISWFVEKIWPTILQKHPELKLYVIGKNIDEKQNYQGENVKYLGFVDDIYQYYKQCECFIVPLTYGGGTRLKVLEAMSFKVPIVSTRIGAEGLNVQNNVNIILEDSEHGFAESVNYLIDNRDIAKKIAKQGYQLVLEQYDWRVIHNKIYNSLKELE